MNMFFKVIDLTNIDVVVTVFFQCSIPVNLKSFSTCHTQNYSFKNYNLKLINFDLYIESL